LLQERKDLAQPKPTPKNGTLHAAAARQREQLAAAVQPAAVEPELEQEAPEPWWAASVPAKAVVASPPTEAALVPASELELRVTV
jgi:hypothetical protein